MKENYIRSFIRDTYRNSPIPYIITVQVLVFVLLHVFELLSFSEVTDGGLFSTIYDKLRLPTDFVQLLSRPWAIVTHPFIYKDIFTLLFDCLWLYWVGNLFLQFLNNRQFWVVFGGGLFLGALVFLTMGQSELMGHAGYLDTNLLGLAALMSSIALLTPNLEVSLFLFGRVRLMIIAIVYLVIKLVIMGFNNPILSVSYISMIVYGVIFMIQLKNGNDWSKIFVYKKRRTLKVVHNRDYVHTIPVKKNQPSQEEIDRILDLISQQGYDKLSAHEKEVLFRASKQQD